MISGNSARDHHQKRDREKNNASKDVAVEPITTAARRMRTRLEKDDAKWLRYVFADDFWYSWTDQQLRMIQAINAAITIGGDQSIAASRGEGKTTIAERLLLKYTLSGVIKFSVLFAATGSAAETSLESIKLDLEENQRLLELYPEICIPVRALENTPNRAHYQTVSGIQHDNKKPFSRVPSRFQWSGQQIVFPNVPGAPGAGAVIATRGLDSAVRGLKKRGKRPDLAIIDDPDTEDSARSEHQAKKLEDRIDKAIGGLGGQQRPVARVMLTTLQTRTCVSYRFTDRDSKPTWNGVRHRFLETPPERSDLWDTYMELRRNPDDQFGRAAHAFYLENRDEMERGAVVANPNRYNGTKLPDGTQLEVSALQHYYNQIVRTSEEAVKTELDNNPPEDETAVGSGLTPRVIQESLSGYARNEVPEGVTHITQGIDVGQRLLHWCVRAWSAAGTGYVIDYGTEEVFAVETQDAIDLSIEAAIRHRLEYCRDELPYQIDKTLVDSRFRNTAVYQATADRSLNAIPAMGNGQSAGHGAPKRFIHHKKRTSLIVPGDGWYLRKDSVRQPFVCMMDSDRWKTFEHDRWLAATDSPEALLLFGQPSPDGKLSTDGRNHFAYARAICSEEEVEEVVKMVLTRYWKQTSHQNHWLDASYMATVGASMLGVNLYGARKKKRRTMSLSDMGG